MAKLMLLGSWGPLMRLVDVTHVIRHGDAHDGSWAVELTCRTICVCYLCSPRLDDQGGAGYCEKNPKIIHIQAQHRHGLEWILLKYKSCSRLQANSHAFHIYCACLQMEVLVPSNPFSRHRDVKVMATLKRGDTCGEAALLVSGPGQAMSCHVMLCCVM